MPMKTMTCEQLGGPCDFSLRGESADDVIKAQDNHLKDAVTSGEHTHDSAATSMKNRWKHPIAGMGWYMKVKQDFASLPDD